MPELLKQTLDFIAPIDTESYREELADIQESEELARQDLEEEQENDLYYLLRKEK